MSASAVSNGNAMALLDRSEQANPQPRNQPDNANTAARGQPRFYEPATLAGSAPGTDTVPGGPGTPAKSSVAATTAASGPTDTGATATAHGAPAVNSTGLNSADVTRLLNHYESQMADATNIQKLEHLQQLVQRGGPSGAAQFEADQQNVGAKTADLPPKEQDYYRGAQAALINHYETADTKEKRDGVIQQFNSFTKTLDEVHSGYMSDPSLRTERYFGKPYGSQFLDEKGQAKAGGLEQYREAFNSAKNAGSCEAAFAGAAALKRDLQQQIGNAITQSSAKVETNWKKSEDTILNALNDARQLKDSSDANNNSAFVRLEVFGKSVFTSESNARAFKAMQQEHPEKLAELGKWANEAGDKTAWAQKAIQSDPLKREFPIQDVPKGYLNIDENRIPLAHFGEALLTTYQDAGKDVKNADELYHAAQEHGPIKEAYIRAHTPPKPEWQQQVEEVFCRLTVGALPIVGFATNQICPRSNMSEDARKGVDIVSGMLGSALGGVNGPGKSISGAAVEAATSALGRVAKAIPFPKRLQAASAAKAAAGTAKVAGTTENWRKPSTEGSAPTGATGKTADELGKSPSRSTGLPVTPVTHESPPPARLRHRHRAEVRYRIFLEATCSPSRTLFGIPIVIQA